jgi:hypothetical protein
VTKTILNSHKEKTMLKQHSPSGKQTMDIPSLHQPLNWTVDEFCKSYGMTEKEFCSLVKSGELSTMKRGSTTLISEAELRRYRAAVKAAEV